MGDGGLGDWEILISIHHPPSTVHCSLFTVHCQLSTVHCLNRFQRWNTNITGIIRMCISCFVDPDTVPNTIADGSDESIDLANFTAEFGYS